MVKGYRVEGQNNHLAVKIQSVVDFMLYLVVGFYKGPSLDDKFGDSGVTPTSPIRGATKDCCGGIEHNA